MPRSAALTAARSPQPLRVAPAQSVPTFEEARPLTAVPALPPEPPRSPGSRSERHLRLVEDEVPVHPSFGRLTSADIPPPATRLIQKLALFAFEALEGSRAVAQLGGWVTPEVVQQLRERRAARTERRTLYGDERRIVATPGRAHIGQPLPHIVEATVVLYAEPRTRAVALRFEHVSGRWRATDLTVL